MSTGPSRWRQRLRHPQTTVRLRLTLLYGALFLACGAGLLAITYTLVDNAGVQRAPVFTRVAPSAAAARSVAPSPRQLGEVTVVGSRRTRAFRLPPSLQRLLKSGAGRQAVRAVVSDQRIADEHQLIIESAIALAIMAIVSTGLGWLVAGRVLRPLRVMTVATREISAANLHERLNMPGPRDELRALADTIDGLLGRLEGSFVAQRRFVMNASHELRTPLTAVRALLEMVLADPDATVETYREISHQVLEENHQQEELIEALLTLAQGQRGITHTETMDLAEIVQDAIDRRGSELAAHQLQVEASLAPSALNGDRRLIERLVSNLLDNAIVHNVAEGKIELSVAPVDQAAQLVISNTGTDVPEVEIERLVQPFQRLAPERTGPRTGLGLGLSIVAAIAEAHDAALELAPTPGGGLTVTVRFPAMPADPASTPAISEAADAAAARPQLTA